MEPITGGCLCGRVRYTVDALPRGLTYCHCTRCQRRTGTAFAVSALTQPGSVTITEGADHIRTYAPESGFHKQFCGECGSQLFAVNPQTNTIWNVRFGTVDDPPPLPILGHQFVAYAAAWQPLPEDGAPRFDERIVLDAS